MEACSAMTEISRPAPRGNRRSSHSDRWYFGAFLLAIGVLLFLGGSLVTVAGIAPGPQIRRAYEGGKAYYSKSFSQDDVYASDLWNTARSESRGVTVNDKGRAEPGATLYTSSHEPAAFLISDTGEVLHEWKRPFSEVWHEGAAVKHPQPDKFVYMRRARLTEDGGLLAIYEGAGDTPYGYGMVKLDKDSNIEWTYLEHTHHDFDVAPDGTIYVLTHEIVDEPLPQLDHLASPRMEDYLAVLSPEGKELRKIPLLPTIDKTPYRQLFYTVSSWSLGDPLHTNAVHFITPKDAENFTQGKAGQVLISFRELNAVGVLDLDEEKLAWAVKGYWTGQHDPQILENGNILLFDNNGNLSPDNGGSRVIEFDPENLAIAWQYTGTKETPLYSPIRSEIQRLPNGNTLITEASAGRIVEVTPDKQVVWEYINPVRAGADGKRIPIICNAQRIAPETVSAVLAATRET
jgi:hypothetical protein